MATINPKSVAGYLAAFSQFVNPHVPIWQQMGCYFSNRAWPHYAQLFGLLCSGRRLGTQRNAGYFAHRASAYFGALLYHLWHFTGPLARTKGSLRYELTGSCECGRVTFSLSGTIPDVELCHCSQCRKTSGHIWASVLVPDEQCKITSDETLKWRRSSDSAQRGFCTDCGSSLFYKHDEENKIAVAAGALETPTGLGMNGIFL